MNGRNMSNERIRLLHLSPSLDQGGLEKLQIEFARHADRDRFDLRFVALCHGGRTVEDLKEYGVRVDVMNKPPGLRPLEVFKLAKLFRSWRTDVLHTHNNGPLLYGASAGRLAGVPVIVHTRHHGRDDTVKRREISMTTKATNLVDTVVCVSEDSLTQGRIDGIDSKLLQTIWNGIDVTRFDYRGPTASGPAVVVARLNPEKSIDTLLRAMPIVLKEIPDYRVSIAGDGVCQQDLIKLAQELGISSHVDFLGNVKDVPGLLARCSVMVLPSLTEGISLTLLEAMARGLPVVCTKVGGNPEVVVQGETGLLVPPSNPAMLAEALIRIHRDPDLARGMGLAGRERIERHFDVRRMVEDYEELYLSLLQKKRPGRVKSLVNSLKPDESKPTSRVREERLVESLS
jgi:glycosyltransferase involved in cell wall biosynthesis